MEKTLSRIEAKVDRLDERLDGIDRTLVRNTADLEYHIKRTDLLEKQVKELGAQVKPIAFHVQVVGLVGRALGFGLGGGAIWKFVTWLLERGHS